MEALTTLCSSFSSDRLALEKLYDVIKTIGPLAAGQVFSTDSFAARVEKGIRSKRARGEKLNRGVGPIVLITSYNFSREK